MDLTEFPMITVILPCYNVEHIIERCIEALLSQDYPEDKLLVVVVDDKSTDGTAQIIKKCNGNARIKIVQHYENRGLAAARNSGIKASNSELIAFLDSDMIVKPDWAKTMVKVLSQPEVVGCTGAWRLAPELQPTIVDKFLYHSKRGVNSLEKDAAVPFQWFLFNNAIVKRLALKETGYFNESIKSYGGEDTEMAIRLWEKYPNGLRFSEKAVSDHHHQRTLKQITDKIREYGSTNYLRIIRQYPQHKKALSADYIDSFKGRLIFNPFIRFIMKIIYAIFPIQHLVKYFIGYSLIDGARKPNT